ncbi:hypothetical protein EMN47_11605 [Prolixibacteraceae bacterium JC049]|nr:hypothetical protein [Prolixibacteraceae bacterium JC049]
MKNKLISTFSLVSLCLITSSAYAQDRPKTLLGFFQNEGKEQHVGWFIHPEIRKFYNKANFSDDTNVLVGGKIGLIMNHSFYIGLSGHAKTSKLRYVNDDSTIGVGMGYGGLFIGKAFLGDKIIHPRLAISCGYGGASEYPLKNNVRGANRSVGYLYVEPEAGLELNLSENIRFAFGATYRWLDASNFAHLSKDELNGLSLNFGVVIGRL